jgi:hypothetical protein
MDQSSSLGFDARRVGIGNSKAGVQKLQLGWQTRKPTCCLSPEAGIVEA